MAGVRAERKDEIIERERTGKQRISSADMSEMRGMAPYLQAIMTFLLIGLGKSKR